MKRICEYPGCDTTLSDSVPLQITLCGEHQYQIRKLRKKLAHYLLTEEDLLFFFFHQDGCNTKQLATYLRIARSTVRRALLKGRIKGKRYRDPKIPTPVWRIPYEEMIRAVDLVRNWVTVWQAAKIAQVLSYSLLIYVRMGYFGPYQIHLSGGLAIKRDQLSGLKEQYQKIVKARKENSKNWARRHYLKQGEVSPSEIAERLGFTLDCIYLWLRSGRLPATQKDVYWVIKERAFSDFARKAVAGEYCLKSRTIKALREFLSQQNPP